MCGGKDAAELQQCPLWLRSAGNLAISATAVRTGHSQQLTTPSQASSTDQVDGEVGLEGVAGAPRSEGRD